MVPFSDDRCRPADCIADKETEETEERNKFRWPALPLSVSVSREYV